MTVGKKLTICIGGMLAVVLALAAAGWYSNKRLGDELTTAAGMIAHRAVLGGEIRGDVVALREKQRGVIMYALARDSKRADSNRAEFRDHLKSAQAHLAEIMPLLTTENGKNLIVSISADVEKYAGYFEQVSTLVSNGRAMQGLAIYRDTGSPIGAHAEATTAEYIEFQNVLLKATQDESAALISKASWILAAFVAAGLLALAIIGWVVRGIIAHMRMVTEHLAEGSSQIASGASQVSASSQTLAQGASEQAGSLEETSASAEEITSMTRQNAANTIQVAELMTTVDKRIQDGNSTLGAMLESMKQINASSDKISKIIKVIDEIAFQTNILALNAAVEAARAGEAGMGFAVVADEVRNLAQRSAQAAKDTASLIEESIATSNNGSVQLKKVADVVTSITEAASKVKLLVDEVNVSSQEQARGIEEIARALTEMDRVTQANAAAAEQSASAGQEMSAQAQALNQIVEDLHSMAG
jgi:methyl-accepting chemotaxis protein